MTYDNERIMKVAEELGLKVTFNSENPGIFNSTTGEHKCIYEVMGVFFEESVSELEED